MPEKENNWKEWVKYILEIAVLITAIFTIYQSNNQHKEMLNETWRLQDSSFRQSRILQENEFYNQRTLFDSQLNVSRDIHIEEMNEMRTHARASVKPLLIFDKDGSFWIIKNIGLGPAIILDKKIYLDDKLVSLTSMNDYKYNFKFSDEFYELETMSKDDSIGIGFFGIEWQYKFSKLKIVIDYSSIYEKEIFSVSKVFIKNNID